MKQYIKLSFFLIMAALFMVGCGDNEETDSAVDEEENSNQETEEQPEEETDTSEENEATEEDETNDDSSENDDSHISHQEGLKIGETGTVVDNNKSYEVTLNSVAFTDIVAGLEPTEDIYAVVNITVKNIDDAAFDAKDIYGPSFGGGDYLTATLNPVLFDFEDKVDEDILQGEIAPGEEVTGEHVFDIQQNDAYVFNIGGSGSQIITYAQWELSDSEIE